MGWFQKLSAGLSKTRDAVTGQLDRFLGRAADPALLDELEVALISADLGLPVVERVMEQLRAQMRGGNFSSAEKVRELLAAIRPGHSSADTIRFDESIGVAGAASLCDFGRGREWRRARRRRLRSSLSAFAKRGKRPCLSPAIPFGRRRSINCRYGRIVSMSMSIRHRPGADPAAVAYDGMTAAKARGSDVVLIDTAGRLHTKTNLMEELRKIKRVVAQECQGAPHEVLLVLDATVGQNAIAQARQFHEAVGVTGIALTKLDGTARGGIVVAIADTFKIPVRLIGVGESVEDLQDFDAKAFVDALF